MTNDKIQMTIKIKAQMSKLWFWNLSFEIWISFVI